MLGFILVFVFLLGILSLSVYTVAAMRRARATRRREARLAGAFNRARYARVHGYHPVQAQPAPFGRNEMWPIGSR